jgi:protein O-mannosyl-transferase
MPGVDHMTEAPDARPGRIYWLVAILAIVVYLNSLKNGLVYDSSFMIGSNATFREIAQEENVVDRVLGLERLFHEGFWDGVNRAVDPSRRIMGQPLYRPLMMIVLGASYITFGMTATPVIIISLIWHVLASLLVVRLGYRLANSRRVAAIAGLIFAVHPLHSEAVAYAVGVGETQATVFTLLALTLYGNAVKNGAFRAGRYLLALLAFAIAIFTKESSAALLVFIPLFDVARRGEAPAVRARLLALAGFAVNLVVRANVVSTMVPDKEVISVLDNPLIQEPLLVRLATGVTLYARILHLFVVPWGQSSDYSFNELPIARSLGEPAALTAFLLLAIMTIGAFRTLRSSPALGFGLLFFLFGFGPLSNIPIAHGTIFGERLTYLPSVGLALAAGVLLSNLLGWLDRKSDAAVRAARATLTALLVVLAILCAIRNRAYATQDSLYTDMVKTAPGSARAWYMFGENERRKHVEEKSGDIARAIDAYERAIKIWPIFLQARLQLALAFAAQHEYQRGLRELNLLKSGIPNRPEAREMIRQIDQTIAMIKQGATKNASPEERQKIIDEMIATLEERHRANPDQFSALQELLAAYLETQRVADAEALLNTALLAHPEDDRLKLLSLQFVVQRQDWPKFDALVAELEKSEIAEVRNENRLYRLINLYSQAMNSQDAEKFANLIKQVATLADEYLAEGGQRAAGYYHRAKVRMMRGELEAAEGDLKKALEVEPYASYLWDELASLWVAMKRFDDKTLMFYSRLEQDQPALYRDNPQFHFGFAQLLDGMGRTEEALARIERAIAAGYDGSKPHAFLGAMLIKLGRFEEAVAKLRDAETKKRLDVPDLLEQMGIALFELKRFDDAAAVFERGLKRAQTDQVWFHYQLQMRFQLGKSWLRIPARESEGFATLEEVKNAATMLSADAPDVMKPGLVSMRAYAQRQLAWGYANGTTQTNPDLAISTLETALADLSDPRMKDAARDIGGDLIELLRAAGREARAKEIEAQLAG